MANEIQVTTGLALSNGLLVITSTNTTVTYDQTTARGGNPGVVEVGTSEETVSFGDVTPGWCEFKNLDVSNYVQVGFSTAVYGFRLPANGGSAIMYLESGATVYVKANTAACNVRITALNS